MVHKTTPPSAHKRDVVTLCLPVSSKGNRHDRGQRIWDLGAIASPDVFPRLNRASALCYSTLKGTSFMTDDCPVRNHYSITLSTLSATPVSFHQPHPGSSLCFVFINLFHPSSFTTILFAFQGC